MAGGRPKGATNKFKAGKVAEICESENVCLVRKQLKIADELYADGKLVEAAKIYHSLMRYVYAQRRDEDSDGNAAQDNLTEELSRRIEETLERLNG